MIEQIYSELNISTEVSEKLNIYHALLLKWQKAVNLVSPKTLDEAWVRHFADSVQLKSYIGDGVRTLVDVGSGAGFPGLVLSAVCEDVQVHLVESDMKKCQFLKTVSREADLGVEVHNVRIEDAYDVAVPDVVTARALASLDRLFDLVLPWAEHNPDMEMLFLKGARADEEVEVARVRFDFDFEVFDSVTDEQAKILKICNLRMK